MLTFIWRCKNCGAILSRCSYNNLNSCYKCGSIDMVFEMNSENIHQKPSIKEVRRKKLKQIFDL